MSLEVAASSACWITERARFGAHAEVVLGRGQERRTHPHALRAERQRGRHLASAADAARGEHRRRTTKGVNNFGHQDHRRDLTGVPAGLMALGDHDVDAVLDMPLRVLGAAGQCGHRDTGGVHLVDDVLGRRAQRVGDQFDRVLERHLDVAAGHRVQPAQHALGARLVLRQGRHAEVGEGLGDEVAVRLRDQLVDVDRRALGRHLGGHDDIDAVRLAIGVGVHPLQDALEIVGVVEPDAARACRGRPRG